MARQVLRHTSIAFTCLWQKTATLNCQYAGQWACGFRQVQGQPKFWCVIGKREILNDGEFFVRWQAALQANYQQWQQEQSQLRARLEIGQHGVFRFWQSMKQAGRFPCKSIPRYNEVALQQLWDGCRPWPEQTVMDDDQEQRSDVRFTADYGTDSQISR